jgi:hypothetical protein
MFGHVDSLNGVETSSCQASSDTLAVHRDLPVSHNRNVSPTLNKLHYLFPGSSDRGASRFCLGVLLNADNRTPVHGEDDLTKLLGPPQRSIGIIAYLALDICQ